MRRPEHETKRLVEAGGHVAYARAVEGGALHLARLRVGPEETPVLALVEDQTCRID